MAKENALSHKEEEKGIFVTQEKKIQFSPAKIIAELRFFPEYSNVYMKE